MNKTTDYIVSKENLVNLSILCRNILKFSSCLNDETYRIHFIAMEEVCHRFLKGVDSGEIGAWRTIIRCHEAVNECVKILFRAYNCTGWQAFLSMFGRNVANAEYILNITMILRTNTLMDEACQAKDAEHQANLIFPLAVYALEKIYLEIVSSNDGFTNHPTEVPNEFLKKIFKKFPPRTLQLVPETFKGLVCMENAVGNKCYRNCDPSMHSSKDRICMSYTEIGTARCCYRDSCVKNQKVIKVESGGEISVCPFLHGDQFDEIKKFIGRRWVLYSEKKIEWDSVFKRESDTIGIKMNGEGTTINSEMKKQQNVITEEVKKKDEEKYDNYDNYVDNSLLSKALCNFLPCMFTVCGQLCGRDCDEHSNQNIVYYSYLRVGSQVCKHGTSCSKFERVIRLFDGRKCDSCPFLHGVKSDDVKKRLALGWELYSQRKIKFPQIFTTEDISHLVK